MESFRNIFILFRKIDYCTGLKNLTQIPVSSFTGKVSLIWKDAGLFKIATCSCILDRD
jgi:hypothetical protein